MSLTMPHTAAQSETIAPYTRTNPKVVPIELPDRRLFKRITIRNLRGLARWLRLRLRYPRLRTGLFYIGDRSDIRLGGEWSLEIGRDLRIDQDTRCWFHAPVKIGDGVGIGRNVICVIHAGLTIGDNSALSEYSAIHDYTHDIRPGDDRFNDRPLLAAPVTIGKNVWVGAKVVITSGVTIGDNSVIGANSVVTRDIPPNSIAAGIPARVIRAFDDGQPG
jgi:acetyltransferase-like isoleucine patch superfamily enzyme